MFSAGRVLIKPKGDYSPLTTYEMLDYVSYNGSSYVAKKTTTGNLPTNTEYWQLAASGAQSQNVTSNFAEVEGSDIASSPHAIDDVFVNKDGKLLKATLAISIGDTIVIDTNCEPTTVEDLISYLSTQVSTLDSSNKKLNGITEIAVQTDLHTLSLGEFYKDKTSFYVTNGPEEVDEVVSAIFRLTVESALDGLSTTRLLTLKTPGGKVYTQNYDGSSWGDWEQVASESEVELKQNIADNTLQTTSKTVPGAINELFLKSETLTNQANDMVNVLGAKNLLPNSGVTVTKNGLTFTVNDDGSITVSGVATAETEFIFCDSLSLEDDTDYILTGCPSGGSSAPTYLIQILKYGVGSFNETGSGKAVHWTSSYNGARVRILIGNGQDFTTSKTFYPMIRLASITDDTYVPYSMTNREMTPYVQAISNPNLLDNPWFTVNQRGFTSNSNPSVGTHVVDRWAVRYNPSSGAVAVANNIVTLTSNGGLLIIGERFEENVGFSGKTMTASIMLSDGTIYSGTGVFPSKNGTDKVVITTDDFNAYYQYSASSGNYPMLGISCQANKTTSIKVVKLELGSVSTLAMDTAPNYTTELLKCQRYYHKYATEALRPTNMYDCVPEMRVNPTQSTITIGGTTYYVNSADL